MATESGPPANIPGDFNSPYDLSARWDEYYPHFTDVDDYNNLQTTVTTDLGAFNVSAIVYYVDDNNPDGKVYYRTCHKKMTVTVSNQFMPNDIVLSHVYSYYDF